MATYIINPSESVSHSHKTYSTSTLLEGKADIVINDKRISMILNEPISVPPNTEHEVINTGDEVCKTKCWC